MAYITEFTIHGLAGRSDVYTQKLNPQINAFFGLNGSGKTSLLKILNSALSNDTTLLKNVVYTEALVEIYVPETNLIVKRSIKRYKVDILQKKSLYDMQEIGFLSIHDSFTLQEQLNSELLEGENAELTIARGKLENIRWTTQPRDEFDVKYAHQLLPTSRLFWEETSSRRIPSEGRTDPVFFEERLDRMYSLKLQELWNGYFSSIAADIRKAQEDGLENILKAVLSPSTTNNTSLQSDDLNRAYNRVTEFLQRRGTPNLLGSLEAFSKLYKSNPSIRSIVSDIDEVEKRIAVAMEPRDTLQELLYKMVSGNKKIIIGDTKITVETEEGNVIKLGNLSSGEKHLLRIFVEILSCDGGVFLIDEPELSMHIDWQRQLVGMLRTLNPTVQIILATHSPEILADIPDEEIFRL